MPRARDANDGTQDKKSKRNSDGKPNQVRNPQQEYSSTRRSIHRATDRSSRSSQPSLTLAKSGASVTRQTLPLTRENLRNFQDLTDGSSRSPTHAYMRNKSSPSKKDKKRQKEDRDSHPLNLPPDELRRLSAAMARREPSTGSMDVDADDHEPVTSPTTEDPSTSSKSAPGAFPESAIGIANGVNGNDEKSPTPPPHKVPPKTKIDAEACKAAGNKFFKAKDYARAISEYSKGLNTLCSLIGGCC